VVCDAWYVVCDAWCAVWCAWCVMCGARAVVMFNMVKNRCSTLVAKWVHLANFTDQFGGELVVDSK
jgi:hypothetical protein